MDEPVGSLVSGRLKGPESALMGSVIKKRKKKIRKHKLKKLRKKMRHRG